MVTNHNKNLEFSLKPRTLAITGLMALAAYMLPNLSFGNVGTGKIGTENAGIGKKTPSQITERQEINHTQNGYILLEQSQGRVDAKTHNEYVNQALGEFATSLIKNSRDCEALKGYGLVHMGEGYHKIALKQLDEAYLCNQTDLELIINIARASMMTGNFPKADKFIERALEINASSSEAYDIAGLIANEEGDKEASKIYLLKSVELNPKNSEAMAHLAVIYGNEKDYANSDKWFEKAITVNPNDDVAYHLHGLVLKERGMEEKAKKMIKNALKIKPYAKNYKDSLNSLNSSNNSNSSNSIEK